MGAGWPAPAGPLGTLSLPRGGRPARDTVLWGPLEGPELGRGSPGAGKVTRQVSTETLSMAPLASAPRLSVTETEGGQEVPQPGDARGHQREGAESRMPCGLRFAILCQDRLTAGDKHKDAHLDVTGGQGLEGTETLCCPCSTPVNPDLFPKTKRASYKRGGERGA